MMAEGSGMSPVLLGQISIYLGDASLECSSPRPLTRLPSPDSFLNRDEPPDARLGLLGVGLCSGQHPRAVFGCDGPANRLSRARAIHF
jgi:hypothetical protein